MFLRKVYALFYAGTLMYLLQEVRKWKRKSDRVCIKKIVYTVSHKTQHNPSLCHKIQDVEFL
jgi:hypothetical protein